MASLAVVVASGSSHLLPSSATRRKTTITHASLSSSSSSSSSSVSLKSLRSSSSFTPFPSLFITHQTRSFNHIASKVSSSVVSSTSLASDPDQLKKMEIIHSLGKPFFFSSTSNDLPAKLSWDLHSFFKLKIETTDPSSSQEEEEKEEDKRNWLELPPDVTFLIFLKLGTVDILGSVQWVCSSWWKLSKQPHLFRSIHVENVSSIFGYNRNLDVPYNFLAKLSEGLAREAIDRSCGQLVEFSVRAMPIDELLHYMSEKSSSLRSLQLVEVGLVNVYYYDDYPTNVEFIEEIAKKLPHLEEVEFIKCSDFSKDVIKTFGRFCPQLKSCRLNYGSDFLDKTEFNDVALAIAENMPELRHLNLLGNQMKHYNLTTILDGCPHLESLDLRRCFYDDDLGEDLEERCKNIKVLRLPKDPTDDFEYDSDDEYGDDNGDDDYGMPNEYYETDHWSR